MIGYFKKVKICCTLAGAAAVLVGQKILESETVRKTAVDVMAAGIKAVDGVKAAWNDIFDEASKKVDNEKSCGCGEEQAESSGSDGGFDPTAGGLDD